MTDHGSPTTSTAFCYRHPDRPTRLSCSECGRPICVECSNDAAVGQKCPECSVPVGRNRVIDARTIRRVDRATTPVTWTLIAVNVAVFLIGRVDPETGNRIFREFSQIALFAENGVARGIDAGEVWRG
ncbi:MAG: rhomboid family intramembrane serine protease, partial [Actinobacteria bacterium]|nr:rhomboid family intramembrane serine protease [Actinomycetota bacterium]NIS32906.1 rhomboid family intramembrane serine protease [Actinomycetota bacterium]NIT96535.1 rhomboid family intramembrane serine protease [Actinomycetota bacterium]NIU20229.1 rhomboid family intramembrane serine protease [Actinomycetota bacterium]NIU67869.1 rhomboid family intramembrane serine protease [Actinomycetota bacterium]